MSGSMKGTYGDHKGTVGQKERFKDQRHDTYQEQQKGPDPARCPTCGAVFIEGRWTWQPGPPDAHEVVCPACKRIADDYPAGFIEIKGPFFDRHREEILGLIRNTEEAEKQEHPLERLIAIRKEEEATLVTTTGVHLARRIGKALARAYDGELTTQYAEAEQHVRIVWER